MREETLLNIFRQLNEENQYILIAEADSLRTAQKLQEEHLKPEKGKNIIKLPKNRGGGVEREPIKALFFTDVYYQYCFFTFLSQLIFLLLLLSSFISCLK